MTNEEAIILIECSATELVGAMAEAKNDSEAEQIQRNIDAYDMAISALRQQEHFRDCTKKVEPITLVRCRECIAYTPVDDNTGKCVFLIGKHQYVVPDGYCYLGERKEGADNG